MKIAKNVNKLGSEAVYTIFAKTQKLEKEGKKIIDFSAGEPDFDTPDNVKNAAIEAIKNGQTKYTPVNGTKELNTAIINTATPP